jgi:histidine triad (HIT) family protein
MSQLEHKPDCLFCRIARGEIASRKVYEDDEILAFHDIHPSAPVHILVIPKIHLDNLYDGDLRHQQLLGRMLGVTGQLAAGQGATDGWADHQRQSRAAGGVSSSSTCLGPANCLFGHEPATMRHHPGPSQHAIPVCTSQESPMGSLSIWH